MRSPTFELIRMNAAETRASNAIADCTPLAVVSRSFTTAEIDTFMNDVSTTSTNIAAANSSESRVFAPPSACTTSSGAVVMLRRDLHPLPRGNVRWLRSCRVGWTRAPARNPSEHCCRAASPPSKPLC
jgi:hypothetical protein